MTRTDMIYSQGRGECGRALPVQCTIHLVRNKDGTSRHNLQLRTRWNGRALLIQYTMTKSAYTTSAHIKGPATQRPADVWITATALHFIGVLFCCAACLEVSRALEVSPTLHHGSQTQRVNTTTTLMVAPARTQTCSRVQSICQRRHVSPLSVLMLFAPIACMHAFCRTTADTVKNPTKVLMPYKPTYIPLEWIRWIGYPWGVERFSAISIARTWLSTTRIWQIGPQPWPPLAPSPTTWW